MLTVFCADSCPIFSTAVAAERTNVGIIAADPFFCFDKFPAYSTVHIASSLFLRHKTPSDASKFFSGTVRFFFLQAVFSKF